jgi:hypothetical protein
MPALARVTRFVSLLRSLTLSMCHFTKASAVSRVRCFSEKHRSSPKPGSGDCAVMLFLRLSVLQKLILFV